MDRTGGVYIPPFKRDTVRKDLTDETSVEYQKYRWDLLRKSLTGIVNKVNISNISAVVFELFDENLLRGKGLLTRSVLKAQMAAPNFSHVYAALVAVLNTKLPEIGSLLLHRVVAQFQRAYRRNDKLICLATTKFVAHLVNQQVAHELLALELAGLLLEQPTEDSVEIACEFLVECGQVLTELCPLGVNAIFDRFRGILQEGETSKRVQYIIEKLMAIRKTRFRDHPGVLQELDLVEDEDKVTHELGLDDELATQEPLNVFAQDAEYAVHEAEWTSIKAEILGESAGEESAEELVTESTAIQDCTERDALNLRKTLYLVIMSSVDYEECASKILRLNVRTGQESVVARMVLECGMHERSYLRFFGLLAQRFCDLFTVYQELFEALFTEYYATVHRLETNRLRNLAQFFAHLLFTGAVSWAVFCAVQLLEEETTASSRIFIKVLMQEICENIGLERLKRKLNEKEVAGWVVGLFPGDSAKNTRFAINFFTAIGLGGLTDEMRASLAQMNVQEESSSSSEDSSSESSYDREQVKKNELAADRLFKEQLRTRRRSRSPREKQSVNH